MMSDNALSPLDVFNLSQLFGGDLTIVIPDIQRDYCWGHDSQIGNRRASKLSLFIDGLIYLYNKRQSSSLGLVYGYEYPAGSDRLMIIDGQQRITTLYLLIGMLYRRAPSALLRSLLISDYKLLDDAEPRLVYQTRSEAMYFLSDLVTKFFLQRSGRLSQLTLQPWYYKSYDSDPTVQSFLGAINNIDMCLEQAAYTSDWDFEDFARFVVNDLSFVYHDLLTREEAEKMYITINTTGVPLTMPQALRSMLVSINGDSPEVINSWEEMEQWAWDNRPMSDPSRPSTSDERLSQFLYIYSVHSRKSIVHDLNSERFGSLYRYFTAYRDCVRLIPGLIDLDVHSQAHRLILLPVIAYYSKFRDCINVDNLLLKEFYSFICNLLRYIKPVASGADTEAALYIVSKMTEPHIESIIHLNDVSDKIVNQDVRATLSVVADNADMRHNVIQLIERAQAHPLILGRASAVFLWCIQDGKVDIQRFKYYIDYIYEIWGTDISRRTDLDTLRRALLSLRHPGYPIVRRGDVCLSLCWNDYDWQRLYSLSPRVIRAIIDRVASMHMPAQDALRTVSEKFNDRSSPYYFLIKNPVILEQCKQRLLIRPSAPFIGYYLQDNAYRMQWYIEQVRIKVDYSRWNTLRAYGTMSIYTDHRTLNLAVSLFYVTDDSAPYRVELFSRDDTDRQPCDIPAIAMSMGYSLRYDKRRRRSYASFGDVSSALTMFRRVTSAF